jgi:hypothetical protein
MLTTDLKLSGHSALPWIPILIAVERSILRLTFYSDLRKYKSYLRHKSTRSRMEADFMSAMLTETMRVEVIWLVHHNQRGKHISWVNLEVL